MKLDDVPAIIAERDSLKVQRDELAAALDEMTNRVETIYGPVGSNNIDRDAITRARTTLATTPAQSLARWQAMARVCEAARLDLATDEPCFLSRAVRDALAALDRSERKD